MSRRTALAFKQVLATSNGDTEIEPEGETLKPTSAITYQMRMVRAARDAMPWPRPLYIRYVTFVFSAPFAVRQSSAGKGECPCICSGVNQSINSVIKLQPYDCISSNSN